MAIPAARLVGPAVGADVQGEVVLPERRQRLLDVLLGKDSPQADLESPALSKDLVDFAAVVRADGVDVALVRDLEVIFAVEKLAIEIAAAAGEDFAGRLCERRVADFAGHLLARPQGRQVKRAEPGDLAEPGLIERVVLGALDQALAAIHVDEALHRQLDPRPEFRQQGAVARTSGARDRRGGCSPPGRRPPARILRRDD